MKKSRDLLEPFKAALNGFTYTFKTQRHMRFHLYTVLVVLLLGVLLGLQVRELLILLFTISLVVVAEMFNSAIEATVDLVSPHYNPLAKFAKDIAAGAVLITTILAIVVGSLLIFGDDRWESLKLNLTSQGLGLAFMPRLLLGAFLLFVIVVIGKGLGKRGTVLRGGLVSGHAAYAFFFAFAVPFVTDNFVASALAILLAIIVAQSRYEARIHSLFELGLGASVGSLLSLIVFGVVPK